MHSGDEILNVGTFLRCPICFEISVPPIYNCVLGHSLCKHCNGSILRVRNQCPVCQQPLLHQGYQGRNFPLESIYNATKFQCIHKDFGCNQRVSGNAFQKHVLHCSHRPYNCILTNSRGLKCGQKVDFKSVLEHLTEMHFIPTMESGEYCPHKISVFLLSDVVPILPIALSCWTSDGQYFLEQIYKKQEHFYINILLIGETEDAAKYKGELQIIKQGQGDCAPNILKGTFPIEVRSVREPLEEVEKTAIKFPTCQFLKDMCRINAKSNYFWISRLFVKVTKQDQLELDPDLNMPSISLT